VARYVLSEMRALAQQEGFRLVLAMDGVRDAIYAGKGFESYEVGKLNRLVGEVGASSTSPPRFARDLRRPPRPQSATLRVCLRLALERPGEPSRR
jgi:hypothetical protein